MESAFVSFVACFVSFMFFNTKDTKVHEGHKALHRSDACRAGRCPHIPKFRTSSKSPVCGREQYRRESKSVGLIFFACPCFQSDSRENCWISARSIHQKRAPPARHSGHRESDEPGILYVSFNDCPRGWSLNGRSAEESRSTRPSPGERTAVFCLTGQSLGRRAPCASPHTGAGS
jgi:hypothetical protein